MLDTAQLAAFAAVIQEGSFERAAGTLHVTRYGQILRTRMLVGVRGAGLTYDGLYYVESVTHNLKRGEYKQSFSLSREPEYVQPDRGRNEGDKTSVSKRILRTEAGRRLEGEI